MVDQILEQGFSTLIHIYRNTSEDKKQKTKTPEGRVWMGGGEGEVHNFEWGKYIAINL